MSLAEIIIGKIQDDGPLSFHDFMEMALYHPEQGYYVSDRKKIGPEGDYYTSPHFTFIFGEMIGRQIEEMWHLCGRGDFTIVEYGAGTGSLCCHILAYLQGNPELYAQLRYCIIEKSAAMRRQEQEILHEKVTWCRSVEEIAGFTGCVLSNELLDNFSVHRVVMQEELMEVFVDYKDGFTEVLCPAPDALKSYLEELRIRLPYGHRAEINLEATDWIGAVAAAMRAGFVLTIDYGYLSDELYNSRHKDGTLVCYYRHGVHANPYCNIGMQDITAHVNFSALNHWGAAHGLQYCGYTDQRGFLHALGIAGYIRNIEESGRAVYSGMADKAMLIHTLLMDMGAKFKVLIQQKGMERPMLSGLRFAHALA